jgi:hypothetical protein
MPHRDVAYPLGAAPTRRARAPAASASVHPEVRTPPEATHLPQAVPCPAAPRSPPRGTRRPPSASYHGRECAARSAGPSRVPPHTRVGRGSRRTTAASSSLLHRHRQAAPLFKGRTPPSHTPCLCHPPWPPPKASSGPRALSSPADTPSTFPTSHSSPSAHLLASPCAPLAGAETTTTAAAAWHRRAPPSVAPPLQLRAQTSPR